MAPRSCGVVWLVLAAAAALLLAPALGWPPVLRLSAIIVPLVLTVAAACGRRWVLAALDPVARPALGTLAAAVVIAIVLFWVVLTRFYSGEINAIDFTVYFDRPCFQTLQGRPWFVESAGNPAFAWRSSLYHHAYWAMLPLCSPYAAHPTPLWLLALSVLAVVAGAWHLVRIVRTLGAGTIVARTAALAFILNQYTAGTLNYGFHPEVLYAWFLPWALDAALRRRHWQFCTAMVAAVLVKEDAVFPLFALSMAIGLHAGRQLLRWERALFLAVPVMLATANLVVFLTLVAPAHSPDGVPANMGFWSSYGPTPAAAIAGFLSHPQQVLAQVAASPFFSRILATFLYLPLLAWRWSVGVLPTVVLFATAEPAQLREFGLYYPMLVLPFLIVGAAIGARRVAERLTPAPWNPSVTAGALLVPIMLTGTFDHGYSLRPWRAELVSLNEALAALSSEPIVLVQSSLYPHAGYAPRVQLLTDDALHDSRNLGAAIVLATSMNAFPLESEALERIACLPLIARMPSGLRAVRLTHYPESGCPGRRGPD